VLRTQLQSALRGDVDTHLALREMMQTVDGATEMANQMLALAKIEQLRIQADVPVVAWAEALRAVALDVAALVADKQLDFELQLDPTASTLRVRAHEWSLKELARNLLHNAIRHSPPGGSLRIELQAGPEHSSAQLTIDDSGGGLPQDLLDNPFRPFHTAVHAPHGSGLGLAICHGIVQTLGGQIELQNRLDEHGRCIGLRACVRLPLAEPRYSTIT